MGFLSSKKPSNQLSCVNNIMLYKELIREPQGTKTLARKLAEWIAKLQSSSKSQQQNDTDRAAALLKHSTLKYASMPH